MKKEKKQDGRKNNGGHKGAGRKKIFTNGYIPMIFKFDTEVALMLKQHTNANLLIRNLVNNYFETIKPLDTEG